MKFKKRPDFGGGGDVAEGWAGVVLKSLSSKLLQIIIINIILKVLNRFSFIIIGAISKSIILCVYVNIVYFVCIHSNAQVPTKTSITNHFVIL